MLDFRMGMVIGAGVQAAMNGSPQQGPMYSRLSDPFTAVPISANPQAMAQLSRIATCKDRVLQGVGIVCGGAALMAAITHAVVDSQIIKDRSLDASIGLSIISIIACMSYVFLSRREG